MATKDKLFFIEVLDAGYVVETEGKRSAFQHSKDVQDLLKNTIKDLANGIFKTGVSNLSVKIEVVENVPIALPGR